MFWRSTKSLETEPPAQAHDPTRGVRSGYDPEELVDTLAAILHSLGSHAFDLEETTAQEIHGLFERWSRHVTIGGEHPEDARGWAGRRDLAGLRRFVARHRKGEQAFVQQTLPELKGLVWTLVRAIHKTAREETAADACAKSQLVRLQLAVKERSVEALRAEVLSAIVVLDELLVERKKRQEAHVAQLASRIASLHSELQEARREGETDPLTKLGNRKAFEARLAKIESLCALGAMPSTLLMIDIDHFKSVNDRFGHPVGDVVLSCVADALARTFVRRADFVARYGGEEFAVILHETSATDARAPAARALEQIAKLRFPRAPTLGVTVSIGLAEFERGETASSWVERADRALYAAKQQGRNRVVEAEPHVVR
jgi:diguanylate cyclase (GGDEF)-like protein